MFTKLFRISIKIRLKKLFILKLEPDLDPEPEKFSELGPELKFSGQNATL